VKFLNILFPMFNFFLVLYFRMDNINVWYLFSCAHVHLILSVRVSMSTTFGEGYLDVKNAIKHLSQFSLNKPEPQKIGGPRAISLFFTCFIYSCFHFINTRQMSILCTGNNARIFRILKKLGRLVEGTRTCIMFPFMPPTLNYG
jgi:hypothetical protein